MGKRKGNLEGFADRLRDEMYDKNITQVELSERIGMECFLHWQICQWRKHSELLVLG